ncbi:MAG: SurA N-terminal domain-containing protein [Prevotella sp.]|nr:SurA N-terminal domain-containing protein [Prevotella sp.]
MAAIGKIRSWGPILVAVIGFALFAFIAGDLAKSCEALRNEKVNQVGKVLGEKVSTQEFQEMMTEYQEVYKLQMGTENLSTDQMNQVKDMVWQSYIQNKIVEAECEKLGITVTNKELENMYEKGTNPLLLQTPFVNQQTGRFDVNSLREFLSRYKTEEKSGRISEQSQQLKKLWLFFEKSIRQQLLAQKYQNLFTQCILSNPVEAKMAIEEANQESLVDLATLTYASVADDKVEVSEADLKAKYEEVKDLFVDITESRDIKYVDVLVEPSMDDRRALQEQFDTYRADLAAADDPTDVVRKSTSAIPYLGLPVLKTAFPYDVANRLDSMAVGQTSIVFESNKALNIIKLMAKQQLPDSIEYRQIYVTADTPEAIQTKTDSIVNAVKAGGDFETIAKVYGQDGQKRWVTTRDYQNANSMDSDSKKLIRDLNTMAVNEIRTISQPNVTLITQVTGHKATTTKYTAAVIRKNYEFSNDTYRTAYNKFSSFVSANKTLADIDENAQKEGYTVRERKNIATSEHTVAGIADTRDALKWLFDAKENEVSPLYECGNNSHLLVVALEKVNKAGYRPLTDTQVLDYVKAEVLKDKKAAYLMAQLDGVKSVADAKAKGAVNDSIKQVTFQAATYVPSVGSEPALSGAVAATEKGAFSAKPVKGNNGVYVFQVVDRTALEKSTDVKAQEQTLRQRALQSVGSFFNDLYVNAKVVDNRYLFF